MNSLFYTLSVHKNRPTPGLVLHLLPYYVKKEERKNYSDDNNILAEDQRNEWWQRFAKLKGKSFEGLPEDLKHGDDHQLTELTSQPLLSHIIGLSYLRGKVDFSGQTNLNEVYLDLIESVYQRDYEGRKTLETEFADFLKFLEVVGLSAWHSGDTRTTTIAEIRAKVPSEKWFNKILEPYKENADSGCTKLLTAFYFRKAGQKDGGDDTFEFTHKSFGEYLTARRIVSALEHMHNKLQSSEDEFEPDWTPKSALAYWARVCGPTQMDKDLLDFLRREVKLRDKDTAKKWQETIIKIIDYVFRKGMPMEELKLVDFYDMNNQAKNAEEALLAVHSACAFITEEVSRIPYLEKSGTAFGTWLSRIRQQRSINFEFSVLLSSLDYLDLKNQNLPFQDLHRANLSKVNFEGAYLVGVTFLGANLAGANLYGQNLYGVHLDDAQLEGANLGRVVIKSVASLKGASLKGASLEGASLKGVNLEGANLEGANLEGANLEGVNLKGVTLSDK